jgi:serine/threonine protein kinase
MKDSHNTPQLTRTRKYVIMEWQQLHNLNVIHRKLKPLNILLDDNFDLKVLDFLPAKIMTSGTAGDSHFCGDSSTLDNCRVFMEFVLPKDAQTKDPTSVGYYGMRIQQQGLGDG